MQINSKTNVHLIDFTILYKKRNVYVIHKEEYRKK